MELDGAMRDLDALARELRLRPRQRAFVEHLQAGLQGLLQGLPAKREQRPRGVTSIHYTSASEARAERTGALAEVQPVSLSLVSGAEQRALWRELVVTEQSKPARRERLKTGHPGAGAGVWVSAAAGATA